METEDKRWQCPLIKKEVIGISVARETTPFVLHDRLYRLENVPKSMEFPHEKARYRFHEDEIRVRDVEDDRIVSVVLRNHYFGQGFVWNGRLYVFAGDYGTDERWWHVRQIVMTSSEDLMTWTEPRVVIESENGERLFNTGVCRGEDKFVLLYETDDSQWPPFTFKYCVSEDLVSWSRIPGAVYGRDRYVGGPALYYEGGYYYRVYLHSMGSSRYETRITRSRDCIRWEDAPADRPFVTHDEAHITDPENYPGVGETNASDAELCLWQGKTMAYFIGGNQGEITPVADLQRAEFDGTPRELLEHYFEHTRRVAPG